uniref:Uncharacterized protein n=1 Tax=viral metagenome TaxID=1070528 RepID=A0A6C0KXI1_9ZZZZ
MGSNTGGPFDYDYDIVFDDDYDEGDDGPVLDAFLASLQPLPPDININDMRAFIIDKANNLSNIIRIENGIHHISQVIHYSGYRIKIELDNSDWETPEEMISATSAISKISPTYRHDNISIHYIPKKFGFVSIV